MESEIRAETATLTTALAQGDVAAAAAVYADDARLLVPSAALLQGRAEIEAYWRTGVDLGLAAVAFESRVLEALGAGVLELGRYAVSMHGESSSRQVERGSYLVLHTQSPDGSWRRAVEVLNPDGKERR